jgi:Niemann-Pick C1 protein
MEDQENVKTFRESWLQYLFRKFYAPLLLNRYFKVLVVMIFSSGFLFSLYHVDKVPMGLDQRIALPRDSYLVNYFDGLENYLSVGPPVYFVAKDINVTTLEGQAKLCGRYGGCNERSLAVLLEQERKRPDVSFIAQPTANWLDDYFAWLSPSADLCCRLRIDQRRHRRVNKRSSSGKQASLQQRHTSPTQRRFNASPNNQKQHRFNTLPSRRQKPNDPNVLIQKRFKGKDELCSPDDWEEDCEQCFPGDNLLAYNQTLRGLPKSHQFLRFLDLFLTAMPSEDCALGGAAAYTNAVIVDHERQTVKASHFRTYHTVLKTQKDFIDAYASAKRIARQMSEEHGMQVYPYSIFYVFFEQYTYLFTVGAWMMGGAMVAVFLLCWLFMGNIQAAIIVTLMVVMTVVDLVGGVMMFWGIELNAVTLVNIVICVGISVEFCTHITRAFSITPPSKELTSLVRVGPMSEVNVVMDEKSLAGMGSKNRRVFVSLVEVGSSVFSGITLTKFCGIMVLYFAQSKLFEIYYFRMYLGIVVLGAAHGLILLPILLSWFGSRNILSPIIRIVEHE